ncbi:MAG: hypothetical protein ACXVH1_34695, partial [Solirubrobacteraceae bacterium]
DAAVRHPRRDEWSSSNATTRRPASRLTAIPGKQRRRLDAGWRLLLGVCERRRVARVTEAVRMQMHLSHAPVLAVAL